jgi:hypothetical protein
MARHPNLQHNPGRYCCNVSIYLVPLSYPSDGPSVNYLVTHNLVVNVDAYKQGLIDYQTLLTQWEIKLGESQDFDWCQHGYALCQQLYRHKWKAVYTTSCCHCSLGSIQLVARALGASQYTVCT